MTTMEIFEFSLIKVSCMKTSDIFNNMNTTLSFVLKLTIQVSARKRNIYLINIIASDIAVNKLVLGKRKFGGKKKWIVASSCELVYRKDRNTKQT